MNNLTCACNTCHTTMAIRGVGTTAIAVTVDSHDDEPCQNILITKDDARALAEHLLDIIERPADLIEDMP